MSDFTNLKANRNLIQYSTDRAYLIKLPKSKFKFWFPAKLVQFRGKNNYEMNIGVPANMDIKLFRNGEGAHNFKEVIEEKHITGQQLLRHFTG